MLACVCRKYAIAYQNKDECEFTEAVCACSLIYYAYERYPRLFFIIFTKTETKTNPYSNCIKKNEFIWIFLLAEQPVKWFGK